MSRVLIGGAGLTGGREETYAAYIDIDIGIEELILN